MLAKILSCVGLAISSFMILSELGNPASHVLLPSSILAAGCIIGLAIAEGGSKDTE